MADTENTGIELSETKAHVPINRQQSTLSAETPDEKKIDEHAAGKLPPEAPPPLGPFKLHVQSLKNLVSAGLDMKNKADYDALLHPLMNRCGGSIEQIASNLSAPLVGGLKDDTEAAKARREAFGENRLPEKELVRDSAPTKYIVDHVLVLNFFLPTIDVLCFEMHLTTHTPQRPLFGNFASMLSRMRLCASCVLHP